MSHQNGCLTKCKEIIAMGKKLKESGVDTSRIFFISKEAEMNAPDKYKGIKRGYRYNA